MADFPAPLRRKATPDQRSRRGVTLVEVLVAVAILSIGILGFIGAFAFITKSITVSRARTLATNLAQEKTESLKNISYYSLLITTAPAVDSSFSPPIVYDSSNYPPETIVIGGMTFTRYTHVALAQIDNNVISTVTYTYPDTGMKQVRIFVVWSESGGKKKWELSNLYENPRVNSLDAGFYGNVQISGGGNLAGAAVRVEENPDWNDMAKAAGDYNFRVYHGSYTVRASSTGFYDAVSTQMYVGSGVSRPIDFVLTRISSGSVAGQAWFNPNPLISQIVAGTNTWVADGTLRDVEYIELFNPTTYPINVSQTGPVNQYLKLNYTDENPTFNKTDALFAFTYISTYVPPGRYYLMANATYFYAVGGYRTADAYYGTLYANYIRRDKAGGIELQRAPDSAILDTIGWDDSNNSAPVKEGTSLPLDTPHGLDGIGTGNQIVRTVAPGWQNPTNDALYGRAYDANNNSTDLIYPSSTTLYTGLVYAPHNSTEGPFTVLSGKPAFGAVVIASDTLSGSTAAYATYATSGSLQLPYATYKLDGISTGTWSVEITTTGYHQQIAGVAVTSGSITSIPNATTTPAWPVANLPWVNLSSSSVNGYVKGVVSGTNGSPLSNIQVLVGGLAKTTSSNGLYFASVASGPITMIVNPNNVNGAYVQQIFAPTIQTGQVTQVDVILSQGGVLRGFTTTGTTPLPNVVVTANVGGNQYGTATSDNTGTFTIRNLSTGTYTVQPVLDSGMDSSPNTLSGAVSSSSTVTIGTFTVSGALGTISGTITNAGQAVTTGALILASSATIPASPTAIAASSAPAMTVLYSVSSKADGTYQLLARGSTTYTYKVSAFIPVINGSSVSIATKTYSGVSLGASGVTTLNITLP